MKMVSMKKMMTYGLMFSITALFASSTFAQVEADALTDETITQEVDQELVNMGQYPNASTQSSSYKKVTKTSQIQSTPISTQVTIERSTPIVAETVVTESAGRPRTTKVLTTKTMNSVPVLVKTTKTLPVSLSKMILPMALP